MRLRSTIHSHDSDCSVREELASLFPGLYSFYQEKKKPAQSASEWSAVSGIVANDQIHTFSFACIVVYTYNGGIILSLPPSAPCWTPRLLRLLNNCSTPGYNLTFQEIIELPNVTCPCLCAGVTLCRVSGAAGETPERTRDLRRRGAEEHNQIFLTF